MERNKDRSNAQQQNPGRSPLTEREHQVLAFAAEGQSAAAIAQTLDITKRTVTFHLSSTYRKLQCRNKREAVHAAYQRGLLNTRE
ncbi:MAG: helix-turn-helix transcriptional regulator [Alteromonadaceae bacterium]|nr:helix-turn-helix transcriptional regulator [Alteromonadaceae bacterium]